MSSFIRHHVWIGTKTLPESYGGHYGPVFSEYIESQNARAIPGAHNISLETVLIGNGWYNPLIQVSFSGTYSKEDDLIYRTQYQAYYNFTVICPSKRRAFHLLTSSRFIQGIRTVSVWNLCPWMGSRSVDTDGYLGMITLPITKPSLPKCTTIFMYVSMAFDLPIPGQTLNYGRCNGSPYSSDKLQVSTQPFK